MRRALGFKLAENGRLLPDFVAYLEAAGASTVTTELAVAWATQPTGCTPVWWARRLAMVRGFARHLAAIDPGTEVPPVGVLPHRCRGAAPYLYSDADVAALMAAARALRCPLRAATYETVGGATGRHRDALPGRCAAWTGIASDWDQDEGVLTVWNSKFHKSRALPPPHDHDRLWAATPGCATSCALTPRRPACSSRRRARLGRGFNDVFAGLVRSAGLNHVGLASPPT